MPEPHVTSVAQTFAGAMAAYQSGRTAEARRTARRLVETTPGFGGAHYLLGLLALDAGQGKRAAESLARAIAITPGQAILHLAMGRALDLSGDSAEACLQFRTVLSLMPGHADAHAHLGLLLRRLAKPGEAIDHCRRAVAADPGHSEAWNTLAGLLLEAGQPAEAAAAARRALDLRPDWPAALNNFGVALCELGRVAEAAAILERAVEARPNHAGSRANLAAAYRALGRLGDARVQAERATRLDRRSAEAWLELGLIHQAGHQAAAAAAAFERSVAAAGQPRGWYCLAEARRALGETEKAAEAYGRCLELDAADRHGAALGLALVGGAAAPAKAPEAYVRQLFDDYADKFDNALVDKLEYRAPALLAQALARVLGDAGGLAVLDAGCGTGLAAPVLKPLAERLEGVDLSPAMVAKAALRGLYDDVFTGELVDTLAQRPERYDLVVAADVLVYLGDLAPTFRAARAALRSGGAFAFTVEKTDGAGYELGPRHRYAHAEPYLRRLAAEAGFTVALCDDAVTRRDAGADVEGLVVVLTAQSPPAPGNPAPDRLP